MLTLNHNQLNENVRHAYDLTEKFNNELKSEMKAGSDEHLDLISTNTILFKELIQQLASVNDLIEENFPSNRKAAEEIKFALHSLHSSLDLFISKFKNDTLASKAYRDCILNLETETTQVIEYIQDINDFIISDEDFLSDDFFSLD
jgi:hypothetical protein